jgi:hypothetical protein
VQSPIAGSDRNLQEEAMKPKLTLSLLVSSSILAATSMAPAQHAMLGDKELLDKLNQGAPAEVVKGATVLNMGTDGQMKTVQTGKNGWTCMIGPDGTPMCADQGAMEWAQARKAKGPAPQKLGFIYMLSGDHGASNTDPFATKETSDNSWVRTGPHVMIVGAAAKDMMRFYPRDAKADPNNPYVMWPDTPYEHLMLPVK